MANQEHVTMMSKGVTAWNQWRRQHFLEADLEGADFEGIQFRGGHLGRAQLKNARFVKADLSKTQLPMADLHGAHLDHANLMEANLTSANLRGALLRRANLSYSVLAGVDFSGANLEGANLVGADLESANFTGAYLSGSDLSTARLRRTRLTGAILLRTQLFASDLSEAVAGGTVFGDMDLSRAMHLESVAHTGPSSVGTDTLIRSLGHIPELFLVGCGMSNELIAFSHSLISKPVEYFSCFISYSHADALFARKLHDALQRRGIRCWRDEKQLRPGDDIFDEINNGIRMWDKILLCCSEHSLRPVSWVDKEIAIALEKEDTLTRKRGTKVRALIPLNLDGYLFGDIWQSGYGAEIRRRVAADFTGWETHPTVFESQVESVIRALRADEDAKEKPPEPRL